MVTSPAGVKCFFFEKKKPFMKTVHLLARTASTVGGLKTPIGARSAASFRSLENQKKVEKRLCENVKTRTNLKKKKMGRELLRAKYKLE